METCFGHTQFTLLNICLTLGFLCSLVVVVMRYWISNLDLGNTLHLNNNDFSINGTCKKDAYEYSVPLSNQLERCNAIVLSWLLKSVSEDLYLDQIFFDNATDVWAELKETYDKLDGFVLFNLMQKINSFKQGDLFISEYYHKLNSLWREFDILIKLPRCEQFVDYSNFITAKDAFTIVSREESHREIPSSSTASVFKSWVSSFASVTKFSNTENSNGYIKPSSKTSVKSDFNAFVNADISQSNYSQSSSSLSFTNDQMMKLMALINDMSYGNIQANMESWIIDARANQHMTVTTKNMFGIIDISDLNLIVGHPNVVLECRDLTQNIIIGTSSETGGLYLFDQPVSQSLGKNVSITAYVSKTLWHSRLGHPANQTTEPFPFSDHKTCAVGDLMYLDLWGPYSIITRDGYRYLLTIVDDYSRGFWVYLIKVAYKLYRLDDKSIFYSRDVNFFENVFPFKMNTHFINDTTSVLSKESQLNHLNFFDTFDDQIPKRPNDEERATPNDEGITPHSTSSSKTTSDEDGSATSMGEKIISKGYNQNTQSVLNSPGNNNDVRYNVLTLLFPTEKNDDVQPVPTRKSGRSTKMYTKLNDYLVNSSKNYRLEKKTIGYKWIFKIKYKASGETERYKARCLINIVVQNEWPLYQLDVNNALLYGELFKDVYMNIPPGFNGSKLRKLNKSLYGLKQSPRQWNVKLVAALANHGFVQSKFDYSLFTKDVGSSFVALLVYVDDIVITSSDIKEIKRFTSFMKIHCLSQYMHSPLSSHLKIALRVLRYLKGSPCSD
ncbi:ribonuclease H-like domain-containing protein [Tanacetum coccineum]|uniref:Ribonuclease H-like domain-containing protein n=1 Tax=Tanacetum coccineum TaxID=301880 RepID=A0ABQ5ACN8_9ASTR